MLPPIRHTRVTGEPLAGGFWLEPSEALGVGLLADSGEPIDEPESVSLVVNVAPVPGADIGVGVLAEATGAGVLIRMLKTDRLEAKMCFLFITILLVSSSQLTALMEE
jgi:hypothetical protein